MRTAALVLALTTVTLLGACGDDDDGVAPVDDIVEELQSNGMEPDLAQCMGDAYESAGFTVEDLERLGEGGVDANSEKYQEFAEAAAACTETGTSTP